MSKGGIRTVRREMEANHKDRYEQAYNRYILSQFTYGSHNLIQKLLENSKKHSQMNGVPVYSILIQVSKIMMLNQLELLFFGAIVQQMKWKIVDTSLNQYMEAVEDISSKLKRDANSKKIQLFLLLIAYTVKKYLNEEMSIFDFRIREIFKNSFDKMYQEWVTKVQVHFKFSPKSMNGTFRQLNKIDMKDQQQIVNYNQKVDDLFKDNEGDQIKAQNNSIDYSEQENKNKRSNQKNYRQKTEERANRRDSNLVGVPVQQQYEEEIIIPGQINRGYSGRSQISAKFGKRDSSNQFFSKNDFDKLNNAPFLLTKNFSQDEFGPN